MEKENKPIGCLGFAIGGLSFIPLIGVLFGIIAIIWGASIKQTKLVAAGISGIIFTVVLYGALGYFGFVQEGGVYDELRGNLAKSNLTSLVQAIEFYKVQHGNYPSSLEVLAASLPKNSMVSIYDATQISATEPGYLYYELIDTDHYHVRAYGRDGVLNTADDVLPDPIENIGLVVEHSVDAGL